MLTYNPHTAGRQMDAQNSLLESEPYAQQETLSQKQRGSQWRETLNIYFSSSWAPVQRTPTYMCTYMDSPQKQSK